jgi:hypothetical protein
LHIVLQASEEQIVLFSISNQKTDHASYYAYFNCLGHKPKNCKDKSFKPFASSMFTRYCNIINKVTISRKG